MEYSQEILKQIIKAESGKHLKAFIEEKINELKNIDNLEVSLNPFKTTIELRAVKKAFKILTNILNELSDLEEETPTKPEMPIY